jgi:iron complex transport system substrate-binding protein
VFSRRACRALLCTLVLHAGSGAGATLRDDRGATIRSDPPAARIVTLSPHLAEIVFAAGAGDRLVGVARYSDFPREALGMPRIGDAGRVDLERILALQPDLILAWRSGNPARDVARLEDLGQRVFVTEPRRLSDIPRLLRAIGALAGSDAIAQREAQAFEARLEELRAAHAGRAPVRVFYEIWHRPLLTVSGEHMISNVIELCGGTNVFATAPVLTPAVTLEAVLYARPEAILGGSSSATPQQFAARWRDHPVEALRTTPAFFVAPDDIQRATPRILNGARAICRHLEQVRRRRDAGKSRAGATGELGRLR